MKLKLFLVIILGALMFVSCQASTPCLVSFDEIHVDTDSSHDIPKYIPIFKNSHSYLADPLIVLNKPLRGTNMIEVIAGTLVTNSSADVVYEWYAEEVQNLGWILVDLMGFDGEIARVQAKRGDEFLEISILPDLITNDIHIIYLVTKDDAK
jgi:hypothetical protein